MVRKLYNSVQPVTNQDDNINYELSYKLVLNIDILTIIFELYFMIKFRVINFNLVKIIQEIFPLTFNLN